VEHPRLRLDAFARECLPHLSRRQIEAAIRTGLFSVHGRTGRKGDQLSGGNDLLFCGPQAWLTESPSPADETALSVIYEDDAILAVNKPAGIATHGFSGRDTDTLANLVLARRPDLAKVGKSRWEPGLVHRLDRDTSGVLLVAKTQQAFDHLRAQFRRRQVKKIYWALVWGNTPAKGVIDLSLVHDRRDKRRMRAVGGVARDNERAWKAITRYRRIGQSRRMSLLEIDMETGVTHQIRTHCAEIGYPVVADSLYGNQRTMTFGLSRHFLHARRLTIRHPENERQLMLEAELPEDLAEALRRLKINF
jgi:23S rRNA pseudouridine1911/1915/1917 synthase